MSLESDVHDFRKFAKELRSLKSLTSIEGALESALSALKQADAAESRLASAKDAAAKADAARKSALDDMEAAKGAAEAMVASAKLEASKIRIDAKVKGEDALSKIMEKAAVAAKDHDISVEKFAAAQSTNQEILGMLNAQISHGEQKLAEIRQSLKSITSLTGV